MVVFDLDPGEPATIVDCSQIALLAREVLAAVGLEGWPKSSGSKGMQLYVPLNTPCTHDQAGQFALAVGQLLEKQHPKRVTTTMAKAVRPGKVFVDWSQNVRHKTTIGVYSMRARVRPWVSTPVTWDEVEACAAGDTDLRFEIDDVLGRVADLGDLFAPVLTLEQRLPGTAS
jgi:bifunctional non-homologous end joining protein LigD